MSTRHSNSRRQSYGRRQRDLRARNLGDLAVDLDGPNGWSRGAGWDPLPPIRPAGRMDDIRDGNGAR